ncbi:ANTAR domain-containing response regulator [Acinetobacter shaoyimingii]|uniref:ANTAR domain-containing protein n=1 Tax=Acinetobacter shaoyimingii TaxID=2715164 RepID=A0A6G8RUM1_9GAMM|nr:ANTAR domain-containing protein [Acinetobacter shaoyimingii]NHB58515.1 ANTAR domain-containing protein [Acinetobacter shaoyimingii]QIO05649.1 ANTAR domain-containing protein [Acinetobacter shaoyimingii]
MPKLKIALIDDDIDRASFIEQSLSSHGFDVVACLMINHLNHQHLQQLHADVILLNIDHPQRDIIESCVNQFDLPTVLFTKNTHKETIKNAIQAGVTAYIVDGIDPEKLESILEISIEQFKKHQKLLKDLNETKGKLADRKDIEKAKVMLMQLKNIGEEEAFALLRKNAMSHRMTMGEMARRLLDAQALLESQFKE